MPDDPLKPTDPVDEALGDGSGNPGEGMPERADRESGIFVATGASLTAGECVEGVMTGAGANGSASIGSFSGVAGLRGFSEPGITTPTGTREIDVEGVGVASEVSTVGRDTAAGAGVGSGARAGVGSGSAGAAVVSVSGTGMTTASAIGARTGCSSGIGAIEGIAAGTARRAAGIALGGMGDGSALLL